jgi:hypothetical protein
MRYHIDTKPLARGHLYTLEEQDEIELSSLSGIDPTLTISSSGHKVGRRNSGSISSEVAGQHG